MTDLRKAAEMALAKLEHLWDIGIDAEYKVELLPEIEALRQTLAQGEQEPFGYFQLDLRMDAWVQNRTAKKGVAFYTAPPSKPWVGLTDEEIGDVYVAWDNTEGASFADFARLIETKSRSKNNG